MYHQDDFNTNKLFAFSLMPVNKETYKQSRVSLGAFQLSPSRYHCTKLTLIRSIVYHTDCYFLKKGYFNSKWPEPFLDHFVKTNLKWVVWLWLSSLNKENLWKWGIWVTWKSLPCTHSAYALTHLSPHTSANHPFTASRYLAKTERTFYTRMLQT